MIAVGDLKLRTAALEPTDATPGHPTPVKPDTLGRVARAYHRPEGGLAKGLKAPRTRPPRAAVMPGDWSVLQQPSASPELPTNAERGVAYRALSPRPLFGESGRPQAAHAALGGLGDCWFASSLQSLARKAPEILTANIEPLGGPSGTHYRVAFHAAALEGDVPPELVDGAGKVWVAVDDRFPMQRASDGSHYLSYIGSEDAPWAAVYEKALAKLLTLAGRTSSEPGHSSSAHGGYDALVGERESLALGLLTGEVTEATRFEPRLRGAEDTWSTLEEGLDAANARTHFGFVHFKAAKATQAAGLVEDHSYAVESLHAENQTVTVADPNLEAKNGGKMTLSMRDLVKHAQRVVIVARD